MLQQPVRIALLPLFFFALCVVAALVISSSLYLPVIRLAYVIVMAFFLLGFFRPYWGLVAWLFCVPWFSLTKWTGAMVIEEFDLALWGYCLGVVVHLLRHGMPGPTVNLRWHLGALCFVLLALAWQIAAIIKGYQLLPANGALYFTNYEDQGGPLRIAKALFSALSLYACCRYLSADWQRFQRALVLGFALGAMAVVLGCLFERWHFTGLLNLTTDYRTTAWFWEMHTGGATLDAYLALCLPFILLGLIQAKSLVEKTLFAMLLAGYSYVALTTFSRGVYLAVLLVGVCFFALHYYRYKASGRLLLPANKHRLYVMLPLGLVAIVATLLLFPFGGYRVLLAISGLVLLLMFFVAHINAFNRLGAFAGALAAIGVMLLIYLLAGIAKPVYLLYALCWSAALALLYLKYIQRGGILTDLLLGFCLMLLALLSVAICWYWSDYSLTMAQLPGLLLLPLLALVMLLPLKQLTPVPLVISAAVWALISGVALMLAMFFNSSYIDSRFSTTDQDLLGRFDHWDKAIQAMPNATDIWVGSGVGRFVPLNRERGEIDDQVAILSLLPLQQGNVLYLKSGSHIHGYGELFRITQQISRPIGELELQLMLRHATDIKLLAEICDKQLLYHGKCARGSLAVKGAADGVGHYSVRFADNPFSTAATDNLMSKTFSLAISNPDKEVVIESLRLLDSSGINLLNNSDFSEQMRSWFFSSDRHHMPYHVKGLWPMQLFEMGFIGLILWTLYTALVCAKQLFNRPMFSEMGSAVALAAVGILLVGLFDSVIDGGRMAMLYVVLLLLAGSIRPHQHQ